MPISNPPANGINVGAAFPVAPIDNELFYRTDRGILYYYNASGARWLSTLLYTLVFPIQIGLRPYSTSPVNNISNNPFAGVYDLFCETFDVVMNNSNTTAANYYTARLQSQDGANPTNSYGVGVNGQGDAQNAWVTHSEPIAAVIPNTEDFLAALFTESGAASVSMSASITYRLIG